MTQISSQRDTCNTGLHEATEQLYRAFAKYPSNPEMNISPYFQDQLAPWNQLVASKPLRGLSIDDLENYSFRAMTTWGDVQDFKHFLPRIFELLAELPNDMNGLDEWVTLDKLNYGNYKSWPKNEQGVVHRFLIAFWQKLLLEPSDAINAYFDNCFPAIANVYPDFNQLLQFWTTTDNQHASRRLADFVCGFEEEVLKKQVLPGYEVMPHQGKLFLMWLRSPAVLDKLKQTTPSESYPHIDVELISVIQQLEQPL
ncbi:hypothetical protein [Hymenobacter sp. IS2118]|uniref:hypothetical protein n=1 Tax=Hymenobacter sp. IS2118 TaxID=1505605 RepID=UPI000553D580|nr:hypothetical protein [Hymenobacter sp. IS2118]